MAKYITRTIKGFDAKITSLVTEGGTTKAVEGVLHSSESTEEKARKEFVKRLNGTAVITAIYEVSELRKMSVQDFIDNSEVVTDDEDIETDD